MSSLPRVCIIGAGSSGIAACKVFQDEAIPFDCFEASDRIGGMWAYENNLGGTSAYRSLHINTSIRQMVYSDFPIDPDFPDFPHHSQVIKYFNDYADHFDLRDRIAFNCTVAHCERHCGRRLAGHPGRRRGPALRRPLRRQRAPLEPPLAGPALCRHVRRPGPARPRLSPPPRTRPTASARTW